LTNTEEKRRLFALLGIKDSLDSARSSVASAQTSEQLDAVLAATPADMTILAKDTTITNYATLDVSRDLQRFLTERMVTDEAVKRKYRFSIDQILQNTTVTAKRSVVRVISPRGEISGVYTVYTRTIQAPEATTFVEYIPKSIAADASALHIDGSHEIINADPLVRFLSPSYVYAVLGETDSSTNPSILPVPFELHDPPGVVGLVSGKISLGAAGVSGIAVILVGALLGLVVTGNIMLRKKATASLTAFTELGDIALATVAHGNYATVGRYAAELRTIHRSLPPADQALTADIMHFIEEAQRIHEFRVAVSSLRSVISLRDVTAVSNTYEQVMQRFEALAPQTRAREQSLFTNANAELEQFVTHQSPAEHQEAKDDLAGLALEERKV
jgi:hypothetical protein